MQGYFSDPRQFGYPRGEVTAYEMPTSFAGNRVFLIAVRGGEFPPVLGEEGPFQRVHTLVVGPNDTPECDSQISLLTLLPRIALGVPPEMRMGGDFSLAMRRVRGEILRDETGCLYERVGQQISPIHKLVSGEHGEVLRFAPPGWAEAPVSAPAYGPSAGMYEPAGFEQAPRYVGNVEGTLEAQVPQQTPAARFGPAAYRKLFPDPGEVRLVRLGEFRQALLQQLAHPERLRESHQLPCYVQVYEATRYQPFESLAGSVLGNPAGAGILLPLTDQLAAKLHLEGLLRARPRPRRHWRREPGWLLPFDRVCRLQVLHDPTRDPASHFGRSVAESQAEESASPEGARNDTSGSAAGSKRTIPKGFLKPWEFQLSREEALYDLNSAASSRGFLRSLFRRIRNWKRSSDAFRKWQVLLSGKTLEEQLWAVRPPEGAFSNPAIREWTRKCLELAGYDTRTMLWEWEIFWRRRGLR